MQKAFACSLCHNGILGGTLYLEENAIIYKTNKITVDKAYRNIVLPYDAIAQITWKYIILPIATFHMKNGKKYNIIIFNKSRFEKCYQEIVNDNID